jgi:hypothetical protein
MALLEVSFKAVVDTDIDEMTIDFDMPEELEAMDEYPELGAIAAHLDTLYDLVVGPCDCEECEGEAE